MNRGVAALLLAFATTLALVSCSESGAPPDAETAEYQCDGGAFRLIFELRSGEISWRTTLPDAAPRMLDLSNGLTYAEGIDEASASCPSIDQVSPSSIADLVLAVGDDSDD